MDIPFFDGVVGSYMEDKRLLKYEWGRITKSRMNMENRLQVTDVPVSG